MVLLTIPPPQKKLLSSNHYQNQITLRFWDIKLKSKPFDNRVGLAGHSAEQLDGSLLPHSVRSQTDQEVRCFGNLSRNILPQRHHSLHLLKYRKNFKVKVKGSAFLTFIVWTTLSSFAFHRRKKVIRVWNGLKIFILGELLL